MGTLLTRLLALAVLFVAPGYAYAHVEINIDLQDSLRQEVPSQIRAEDESDEVTLPLAPRFLERIDQLAGQRGLQSSDDYLAQWRWSEEAERDGSSNT